METKKLLKKSILFLPLIFFIIQYVIFYSKITVELPYQTWITQVDFLEKIMDGTVKFSDFFSRYGEHGLFAYNVVFFLNVKWFNFQTIVQVYFGVTMSIIIGFILHYIFVSRTKVDSFMDLAFALVFSILVSFGLFNTINIPSDAMGTQVLLGTIVEVLYFLLIDKLIKKPSNVKYLSSILVLFIAINVCGTLYSLTIIPILLFLLIFKSVEDKKFNSNLLFNLLFSIAFFILYYFEYRLFEGTSQNPNASEIELFSLEGFINLFKAFFAFNGSSLLGQFILTDHIINENLYLTIGALTSILIIGAIVLFFVKKLYKKSFLPLILIFYSEALFCELIIGRYSGWQWYVGEWYTYHVRFALVGTFIIYYEAIKDIKFKKPLNITLKSTSLVLATSFFACMQLSNNYQFERSQFVRQYNENLQGYFYLNPSDYTIDENGYTEILENYDKSSRFVELLKKYKLSFFRNPVTATNYLDSPCHVGLLSREQDESAWVNKTFYTYLNSGSSGVLDFSFYFVDDIIGDNPIRIYANDELVYEQLEIGSFVNSKIILTPNTEYLIKIKLDHGIGPKPNDPRDLGFIINHLKFIELEDDKKDDIFENPFSIGVHDLEENSVWVKKHSIIRLYSSTDTLKFKAYFPDELLNDNHFTITVNDEVLYDSTQLTSIVELEFKLEKGKYYYIKLDLDKKIENTSDIRELSMLINHLKFE